MVVAVFDDPLPPWPQVPADHRWGPTRAPLSLFEDDPLRRQPLHQLLDGTLSDSEAFLARVRDGYDMALHHVDRRVDHTLRALHSARLLDGGFRLVVAGTTGVWLGEEGRVGPGCGAGDAPLRVPIFVHDTQGAGAPTLPHSAASTTVAATRLVSGVRADDPRPWGQVAPGTHDPAMACPTTGGWWVDGEQVHRVEDGAWTPDAPYAPLREALDGARPGKGR